MKNNVLVAKISRYALYESSERFCCCPRKPANPCHPDLILNTKRPSLKSLNTLARAATEPGHALNFAYERKLRGTWEDCERQGITFLPIVAESMGGWHATAEREVKTHWPAGGRGHLPPLGPSGHPPPEGKCIPAGKQGANLPRCCH